LQIFTRSPRMWRFRKVSDSEIKSFNEKRKNLGLSPLAVHIPYLPNLATSDEELYAKSYEILIEDYTIARSINADYFVIHPGAYSISSDIQFGIRRVSGIISKLLKNISDGPVILIENVSGGGRRLGSTFEEINAMIEGIKKDSVKPESTGVCIDTCHLFSAGYSISDKKDVESTLKKFDRTIGLSCLKLIHLNDSYFPFDSRKDRHQHLGKGYIGRRGLSAFINHPAIRKLPFILETPRKTFGDYTYDKRNLAFVRSIVH
ncbi:MAG: deoxyribonuclease IV, partial [Elusimicrobiota bacterium]